MTITIKSGQNIEEVPMEEVFGFVGAFVFVGTIMMLTGLGVATIIS